MEILPGLAQLRIIKTFREGRDLINAGRIFVNNIKATLETDLKDGDVVEKKSRIRPAKRTFHEKEKESGWDDEGGRPINPNDLAAAIWKE